MNDLSLLRRYLAVSIRAQMQYRASFVMASVGQLLITMIEFLGVWALFDRFGQLEGWRLAEVALFYGVVNVAFAIADALTTGFDQFGLLVREGHFDRMLLRPRSAVLQLAGHELAIRRIGRLLQGVVILVWAAAALEVQVDLRALVLLGWTLFGGVCLFYGLFVIQATIAFWTIESLELMNTMTYGGVEAAQYPLAIYTEAFRRFFTFVVPLAAVAYFPVVAILGIDDPLGSTRLQQVLAPGLGVAFLGVSLGLFRLGMRHYASTGS